MPSLSLKYWNETAAIALDRMESAHRAVGGTGRGRRYATQQINQSYLVLLSSHFQQFCRSLHSEAAAHLVSAIDPLLRPIVQDSLTVGRKLDQGNPNPSNLGADFGRLGMSFWDDVTSSRKRNVARKNNLAKMGHWRNAIAHQDFTSVTHVRGSVAAPRSRFRKFVPFAPIAVTWPETSTPSSSRTSKPSRDRMQRGNL